MTKRDEIIEKTLKIPSLPISALEAIHLLLDHDVNINELVKVIETDMHFVANILKLANSAFFGASRQIVSVKDAIMRLGTKTVFHIVIMSTVSTAMLKEIVGYDLAPGMLMSHSVVVGKSSLVLADMLKIPQPKYLYTAGLLHDIGKTVLGTFVEVDVKPIIEVATNEHIPFNKAEDAILGINHAEVGAILLDNWRIPESIVNIVKEHHEPVNEDLPGLDIVHVTDILSLQTGTNIGIEGLNYNVSQNVVDRLKITTEIVDSMMIAIHDNNKKKLEFTNPLSKKGKYAN
jgi:putative nucleotidyltransferase with HDIG domain